mgnify:CR=1 FL=1
MSNNVKGRIKDEARNKARITNDDLICKDCIFKYDDSEVLGNTSRCEKFVSKPDRILIGGSCKEYQENDKAK